MSDANFTRPFPIKRFQVIEQSLRNLVVLTVIEKIGWRKISIICLIVVGLVAIALGATYFERKKTIYSQLVTKISPKNTVVEMMDFSNGPPGKHIANLYSVVSTGEVNYFNSGYGRLITVGVVIKKTDGSVGYLKLVVDVEGDKKGVSITPFICKEVKKEPSRGISEAPLESLDDVRNLFKEGSGWIVYLQQDKAAMEQLKKTYPKYYSFVMKYYNDSDWEILKNVTLDKLSGLLSNKPLLVHSIARGPYENN